MGEGGAREREVSIYRAHRHSNKHTKTNRPVNTGRHKGTGTDREAQTETETETEAQAETEAEEETETETIKSKSHGLLGPETEIQCDISVTGVDHVLVNVCVFLKKNH